MAMTTSDEPGEVANEQDRSAARASEIRIGHEKGTKRVRKGHGLGMVFPTLNMHNPRSHQRLRRREKHCFPQRHRPAKRTHPPHRLFMLHVFMFHVFKVPDPSGPPRDPPGTHPGPLFYKILAP